MQRAASEPEARAMNPEPVRRPPPVTAMVFTLDEEQNLPRCLESLRWCDDVIVIDSFSKDRTEEICRAAGVRFYQHAFEGFGSQRNWAVDHTSPRHDWILVLDADERVPDELVEEMARTLASAPPQIAAYRVSRRFYLWGRWLRHSSLYPTWVVRLVHKDRVRYVNRGHAETQEVEGEIGELSHDLIDENAKGIDEWFERQLRYAGKEAELELREEAKPVGARELLSHDPLERRAALKRLGWRMPGRAPLYFFYSYLFRRGFMDGLDGLVFCSMRAMFQQMIVVKKYDMRKRGAR
jgi:glycosyltransferase involved in cell wall biosynthesis